MTTSNHHQDSGQYHHHNPELQPQQQAPPPLYSDAPEVAQSQSPEHIANPAHYRPDYDGEKVFVSAGYGPYDQYNNNNPSQHHSSYYSADPQAVVNTDPASSPQAVAPGSEPSPLSASTRTEVNKDPKSFPQALGLAGVGDGDAHSPQTDGAGTAAGRRPWWRRKKIIGIVAAVVLIVLVLIIGLAVGLTRRGGGGGDDNSNGGNGGNGGGGGRQGSPSGGGNNGDDVSCDGDLCPSLLSPSVHEELLNVFARTSNGNVAVLINEDNEWSSSSWFDLGQYQDNPIDTQPISIEWDLTTNEDEPRLDVFALSGDDDGTVVGRHKIQEDGTWTDWQPLGTGAGSPVRACRQAVDRIELFALNADSGNIIHNYWIPSGRSSDNARRQDDGDDDDLGGDDDDDIVDPVSFGSWNTAGNDTWDTISPSLGPAASAPAVLCADSLTHLVWYSARNGSVHHAQFSGGSWSSPHTIRGNFVGEPLIVSSGASRFDFFGVQNDGRVYTFNWRGDGNTYSELHRLGGSIVGAPSAVSLSSNTLDVVALGEDGGLKRQHYDGSSWSSGFQDLGTQAVSAPSIVRYADRVYVLSLTQQGAMQALSADISDGPPNWNSLQRETLGGALDSGYFYVG